MVQDTQEAIRRLSMAITANDMNNQVSKLITMFKQTGDAKYKKDAEHLISEFDTWWKIESSLFAPPAAEY